MRSPGVSSVGASVLAVGLSLSGCAVPGDAPQSVRPTSGAHASQLLRDCLQEKGWTAEIDESDGGVVSEFPSAQEDRYIEDMSECSATMGLSDVPELTGEQYESLYEDMLEASLCMTALGYQIPEPPSFIVFAETKARWSPFAPFPEMSTARFNEVVERCPQPQIW